MGKTFSLFVLSSYLKLKIERMKYSKLALRSKICILCFEVVFYLKVESDDDRTFHA